jgi:hypothetical protein
MVAQCALYGNDKIILLWKCSKLIDFRSATATLVATHSERDGDELSFQQAAARITDYEHYHQC